MPQLIDVPALRRLLKLHHEGGQAPTALEATVGISRGTVRKYLARARAAGITAQRLSDLPDAELAQLLPRAERLAQRPEPDWACIHLEMRRPFVTLQLLWQEYREEHPHGYEYSQFCGRYSQYRRCLPPTMRQFTH